MPILARAHTSLTARACHALLGVGARLVDVLPLLALAAAVLVEVLLALAESAETGGALGVVHALA